MIPIVDTIDAAVLALTASKACFITVPKYVERAAQKVLAKAGPVLRVLNACPPLDTKTMFPESLASNPSAKRRVIQRFVQNDPSSSTPEDIRSVQDSMLELTFMMSNVAEFLIGHICFVHKLEAYGQDLRDPSEWVLNVVHYPFNAGEKGKVLFPAHKDWGTLAIYPFIEGEGLEVSLDGKNWEPVIPPENAMLCYAGDILQRVSPIQALLHRVVQPTNETGGRTSCIFYADTHRAMALPTGETVGDVIDAKLRKIGQIP